MPPAETAALSRSLARWLRLVGAFVRLGRPVFLGGGFLLFALGAAVAWAAGHALDLRMYLLGQGAVTCFQLMTHYANDHFDYEADCANATPTRWSGGSRVLPAGELPIVVALVAALVLAGLGLALTVVIVTAGPGPMVLPTLLAMGLLSWFYSAPPLRLHGSGLGELNVALVVTGLVPLLGFQLQAGGLSGVKPLLVTIVPLGLLQIAMLLAIEVPDEQGDRATGKRTLLVRIGAPRAAVLYAVLVVAAFVVAVAGWMAGALPGPVALALALVAPLGIWRAWRMLAGDFRDQRRWDSIAFWSVALLTFTSVAQLAAWLTLV